MIPLRKPSNRPPVSDESLGRRFHQGFDPILSSPPWAQPRQGQLPPPTGISPRFWPKNSFLAATLCPIVAYIEVRVENEIREDARGNDQKSEVPPFFYSFTREFTIHSPYHPIHSFAKAASDATIKGCRSLLLKSSSTEQAP